jgi:hypothetical protein
MTQAWSRDEAVERPPDGGKNLDGKLIVERRSLFECDNFAFYWDVMPSRRISLLRENRGWRLTSRPKWR